MRVDRTMLCHTIVSKAPAERDRSMCILLLKTNELSGWASPE
jgi:hypothetical protein